MSTDQLISFPEFSYAQFWTDEAVYYDTSGSEAEEVRECLVSHSDSDTDTSDAGSDDEDAEVSNISNSLQSEVDYYYGRNKFKWLKKGPNRVVKSDTPSECEPSTNISEDDGDFMSIWKSLINDEILQEIHRWTNVKLAKSRAAATEGKDEFHDLDMTELLSFIGVLVYSALFKCNNEAADVIFATDGTAIDIFKCIMSKDRFANLLKCVRIDGSDSKEAKRENCKLAAISKIFQMFINNCQSLYTTGKHVTVDEVSIPFNEDPPACLTHHRRKCEKLGFQIMCLCDAKTGYFYNGYIFKGADSDSEGMIEDEKMYSVPTRSVLRLSRPLNGTGRSVTCDKCFTSIELIEALNKNGLSCVGAVKKSMKEVPSIFLPSRARPKGSTLYAFTDQITLVSHVPKKGKAVIVASSLHHDEDKSEIIFCLESTMGGVARVDQKRDMYSCNRYTRRGSLAIFYWILDVSLINAHIAYEVYLGRKFKRDKFMKSLGWSLVLEQLQRRVFETQLPLDLRMTMVRVLGADMPSALGSGETRRCYTCPPKLKRKSSYQCHECKKHICSECAARVCRDCASNVTD
ncbi:hypothetical protein ABMA27_007691 [Loxostege sticticalis]|uniref:PiggyBac transposable element-derived protein domain-containing protein n=1 Tax=Loxostege sticticalis TaxID=481309 RepID=A0ABR3HGC5_LOXSC